MNTWTRRKPQSFFVWIWKLFHSPELVIPTSKASDDVKFRVVGYVRYRYMWRVFCKAALPHAIFHHNCQIAIETRRSAQWFTRGFRPMTVGSVPTYRVTIVDSVKSRIQRETTFTVFTLHTLARHCSIFWFSIINIFSELHGRRNHVIEPTRIEQISSKCWSDWWKIVVDNIFDTKCIKNKQNGNSGIKRIKFMWAWCQDGGAHQIQMKLVKNHLKISSQRYERMIMTEFLRMAWM